MAEEKNLHSGHRERLRRRFLEQGLDGFQEHEVLELLLTYAIPRVDVNETAHRLVSRFGGLGAVLDAPLEELKEVEGVGERAAGLIKLLPQLMRRYQLSKLAAERNSLLNTVERAGSFLLPYFSGVSQELVYLLCLDAKGRLLRCVCLAEGTEAIASVTTKKVVETAVRERAFSVILAHNHPDGVPIPSREDVNSTMNLARALELVEIQLVDHLLVAEGEFASMAECGYMKNRWNLLAERV